MMIAKMKSWTNWLPNNQKETFVFEQRIRHLEEAHRILDKQVNRLEKTSTCSDNLLPGLKKQRLHYTDQLSKLKEKQLAYDHKYTAQIHARNNGLEL